MSNYKPSNLIENAAGKVAEQLMVRAGMAFDANDKDLVEQEKQLIEKLKAHKVLIEPNWIDKGIVAVASKTPMGTEIHPEDYNRRYSIALSAELLAAARGDDMGSYMQRKIFPNSAGVQKTYREYLKTTLANAEKGEVLVPEDKRHLYDAPEVQIDRAAATLMQGITGGAAPSLRK